MLEKLAERHPDKAIDYLSERLSFERAGVKLYDRVLQVIQAARDPNLGHMLDKLLEHRDEEREHAEWLEAQLHYLGAAPGAGTERTRLIETLSKGIEEVAASDVQVPHLLDALLTAELVDNAGWDLLVSLADEAHDNEARTEFAKRLLEEADHLVFVRKAVQAFSFQEVLGEQVRMPQANVGPYVT